MRITFAPIVTARSFATRNRFSIFVVIPAIAVLALGILAAAVRMDAVQTATAAVSGKILAVRAVSALWTMSPDGSGQTQLPGPCDRNGDWSPDGSKIVCEHGNSSGLGDLWIMDADGTNAQPSRGRARVQGGEPPVVP